MKRWLWTGAWLSCMACGGLSGGDQGHGAQREEDVAKGQQRAADIDEPAESNDDAASFAAGEILGHRFTPTTHIFVAGVLEMGESLPVMALVQSDTPDICRHLQQGTMPKNASLFAAVLLQTDAQAFSTTVPYPAEGHLGRDIKPYAMGHFRHLDGVCAITPAGEAGAGVSLSFGSVALRHYEPGKRAVADYALKVESQDEALKGHIDATFCDAPKFFERPETFLEPVAPQGCR